MAEIEKGVNYGKYANIAIMALYIPGFISLVGVFSPSDISICFWGSGTCISVLISIGAVALVISSLNSFNKGLEEIPSNGEKSTVLPSLGLFLSGLFLISISTFTSLASSKVNVLTVATLLSGCGNLAIILGFGILISRLLDKETWKLFYFNIVVTLCIILGSMLFTNMIASANASSISSVLGNSFAVVKASEGFFSLCYLAPAYIYHTIHSKIVSKKILLKEKNVYSPYPTYRHPQNVPQSYYNEISAFRYPIYTQNTNQKISKPEEKDTNFASTAISAQEHKIIDAKIVDTNVEKETVSSDLQKTDEKIDKKDANESKLDGEKIIDTKLADTKEEEKIVSADAQREDKNTIEQKVVSRVKCPSCGNVIEVYTKERPIIIECNKCGKKGRLGK
ncbi:MAG: hypothetical protein QXT63_02505 [Thermoplasmata archaeon]